ncbi:MAG: HEAT-like repeat protein [Planctomycetaceae bacterium]|nr:HEAT-like repeat protein [Planctomycetaceae bacterium]
MINSPRLSAFLVSIAILCFMSIEARCPAADLPAASKVFVEHVTQKPKPPEGNLSSVFYAPSKTESPFYNKLEPSETANGGLGNDYDITKKAGKYVAWFGIVREIAEDKAKQQTVLTVEHKYFDGVTDAHILAVSFNGSGDFQAIVPGTGHQIAPLSLVRIYGTVAKVDEEQIPRLEAIFVRDWHWETFTFHSEYGIQRGNEDWRELKNEDVYEIYDPSPDVDYYLLRLGDRPEDLERLVVLAEKLLETARAARPDLELGLYPFVNGSGRCSNETLSCLFRDFNKVDTYDVLAKVLIQALKEGDVHVRIRSVHLLRGMEEFAAPAVPQLILAMSDRNEIVRSVAISSLGKIGRPAIPALPSLIAALRDPHESMSVIIAEVLGEMHAPADQVVPTLILATNDPSPNVRLAAIRSLEQFKHSAAPALESLINLLRNDKSPVIPGCAAKAIGVIDPDGRIGVPVLVEALKSPDYFIRMYAADGLSELGLKAVNALPVLEQSLKDEDVGVRIEAAKAVWKVGGNLKQVIPVLKEVLESGETFPTMCAVAVVAEMGSDAADLFPEIRKLLTSSVSSIKERAVVALGKMGVVAIDAVPDLVELLDLEADNSMYGANDAHAIRAAAAAALWRINRHPRAIPQLLKEVKVDLLPGLYHAIEAIGEIGEPAAAGVPALKKLRSDICPPIRQCAIIALKKFESAAKK